MASARIARHAFPAAAATIFTSWSNTSYANCDANIASNSTSSASSASSASATTPTLNRDKIAGFDSSEKGDFYGLFPERQLWKPMVEYPLWDSNWDGLMPPTTGDKDEDRRRKRQTRKEGVTRHVILIRHGQYTENEKLDENKILTELGRQQADATGRRLKEMIEGVEGTDFKGCNVKFVRVSNLARAKETADIIASHLEGVERAEPDPDLNEGRPSHTLPGGDSYVSKSTIEKTDEQHPRIETAFRKYFYRSQVDPTKKKMILDESVSDSGDDNNIAEMDATTNEKNDIENKNSSPKHEFEIIVCHANVIRYFLCRALQIPPEAWLRLCTFNCSLTYLTIRPTGTVSCRMLGGK
ncbi:MAG: serine/threonine-protein phosphatase PGAM5 [Bacillariaceae sp.]|jgi:serine/threonine-protein phosphatase PGAM5